MRILIADDDVTSRLVLAGVLRKHGHEVLETVDGEAAWTVMQSADAPRLAILDWVMPGLAGLEVCGRVRALGSDQPPYIILLTSMTEKADIVAGLEAGADDYLAKPFDVSELRARVDVGRRVIELQHRLLQARDALAHAAMHDPLTGLLNRRAFSEALARELSRLRRQPHCLALGIFDVDHFKAVNDSFGHQVGDEVLCGLVRRVQANLRGHDILGRLGGDEFLVLTEQERDEDAAAIFERARAAVAARPIPTMAGDVPLTVSFGVKICEPADTEETLVGAADAAMYQAKSDGGNRVCLAGRQVRETA